ncbi:HD-GYP domain-containing protein [Propionivibrio sp.]|uniref:HD-GYP domain-containing protein n=1 Tax=Propionivibrio sp. TaxID=2212460 RepID=UPI00272E46B3|nr:HD-GYP domain-containing protein [Propionivibrio sp.]
MLKKISVKQLTVGMYLKEFCGSWMDHPFWRNSFVITDPKDIERIRASSIKEVWIDCAKGIDVAPDEPAIAEAETEAQVEAELNNAAAAQRDTAPTSTSAEIARAARICAQARRAVTSMFQEARMGKAIDAGNATKLVEEIADSVTRNPGALISLARLKTADDYTYLHSVAVCALMIALGRQLKLDEELIRKLGIAGLLHDLGKAMMPMEVLNKPGKLSDDEFRIMKSHPEEGCKLLQDSQGIDDITFDVVLHHHEKTDGSGYPKGLKDKEISLYAKMGAVCDVYDAITSNRPYKAGWCPAESLRRMAEWANGHFDPTVFQAFVKSLGIYPIGSLVRLNSGRLGLVIEQSARSLLTPRIKVFFSTRSNTRIPPEIIDLSQSGCAEKIASREDPAKWNFPDLDELWSGQAAA